MNETYGHITAAYTTETSVHIKAFIISVSFKTQSVTLTMLNYTKLYYRVYIM